jgi:hypothetical protein
MQCRADRNLASSPADGQASVSLRVPIRDPFNFDEIYPGLHLNATKREDAVGIN